MSAVKPIIKQVLAYDRVITEQEVRTDDALDLDQFHALLPDPTSDESYLFLPLEFKGQQLGMLVTLFAQRQAFTISQLEAVERVQNFCSVTLHNARRFAQEKLLVDRFSTLAEISLRTKANSSLQEVFWSGVSQIGKLMEANNGSFLFCELSVKEIDKFIVKATYPKQESSDSWRRIPPSSFTTPLIWGEQQIGELNLGFSESYGFDQDDVTLLEAIAKQVATVVVNAKIEEQRRAFHEATKLVARTPNNSNNVTRQMLEQIVRVMRPINGSSVKFASIHKVISEDGLVNLTDVYPIEPVEAYLREQVKRREENRKRGRIDVQSRAVIMRKTQLVSDVSRDNDYLMMYEKTCAEVAVPIFNGDEVVAVLNVESEQLNAFSKEDVEAFETFVELVAIAWLNSQRHAELLNTQRRVDSAVALALLNLISSVQQHTNNNRAITIRDRVSLLKMDYEARAWE